MGEVWSFNANKEDELSGFPLLEPGRYRFGIENKKDAQAQSGRPMCVLQCKVLEGETMPGSAIHNVTLIEQGEPGHGFLLHFLHAVGMPYDGEVSFDTDDFIGREFVADVIQETYQDGEGNDKIASRIKTIYTEEQLAEEGGAQPAAEAPAEEVAEQPAEEVAEAPAEEVPAEEQPAEETPAEEVVAEAPAEEPAPEPPAKKARDIGFGAPKKAPLKPAAKPLAKPVGKTAPAQAKTNGKAPAKQLATAGGKRRL